MAAPVKNVIPLSYVQFHAPFLLGGTNFKEKVDARITDIAMVYYRDLNEVHVHFKQKNAIFPMTSVLFMEPISPIDAGMDTREPIKLTREIKPPIALGPIKAQVSAPAGIKV